uniref:response regulator n=1 Tax=Thiocapsa sp. TaxID=2024551 RepID=UPI0035942A37
GRGAFVGLVGGVVVTGANALVSLLQAPALLDAARRLRGEAIKAAVKDSTRRHDGQQGQHILVVDDSLNTREIEKEVLEASGYRVTLAEDGLDGWQKAVGGRFDAVLTDVEMPGLDGFSLTAKLRENDKYRATPIIIVTSRQTREDKQRGIQVGADAYIVKGDFDQSHLVETLRNLLG